MPGSVLLSALSEPIARGGTWWVPKVPAGQHRPPSTGDLASGLTVGLHGLLDFPVPGLDGQVPTGDAGSGQAGQELGPSCPDPQGGRRQLVLNT